MFSRDMEHLRLLSIFHYIVGGLIMLLSSCFIGHVIMGLMMALNPAMFSNGGTSAPPPRFVGWFLAGGMGTFVLCGWALGVMTIYSGRQISRRRARTLSLVVAALDCTVMPFGTILGVFTIVVLVRDSVRALYQDSAASSAR